MQITNPRKFYGLVIGTLMIAFSIVWRLAWGSSTLQASGEFVIEPGTASRQVWMNLTSEGFSNRTLPWKYYSWRQEAADQVKAGAYQLVEGEQIKDVVRRFIAGDTVQDELSITFPEGFTLDQIAERTAARGIGTKEEFIALAADPAVFAEQFRYLAEIPAGRTLEGYLFPDTYRIFADDEPRDVILRMLAAFDQKVVQSGLADNTDRTLDDVVIMASIVEREVQTDDDMALVAGVLWKRYDENIGLAADATTRYVLNKPTAALTVQDLAVDSPYNTRRYAGLPPGPISSPGLRALTASANPETSEYYYYLSAPNGETIFSVTNDEHNVNKARYLQ